MTKIKKILFLIILVISFSCEEQGLIVKCTDCTPDEPVRTELEIKLEFNSYSVPVVQIYDGNLDDSILLVTYKAYSSPFMYDVPINKKYTATATYYKSDIKYVAVDSATPRVKYDKNQCDDPCYFVYDRVVDLRLKYTK